LSKDCGDKKITVNAVAPGGTVTDMFHDVSQHYIPNGEKYTAEEREQVSFCFYRIPTASGLQTEDADTP
jgi:tetrahydroxynaphthalene reductase